MKPRPILEDMPEHVLKNVVEKMDLPTKYTFRKVSPAYRGLISNLKPEYWCLGVVWTLEAIYIVVDYKELCHRLKYSDTTDGCEVQRLSGKRMEPVEEFKSNTPVLIRDSTRYDLVIQDLKLLLGNKFVTKELKFKKEYIGPVTEKQANELIQFPDDVEKILSKMKAKPVVQELELWMCVECFVPLVCPNALKKVVLDGKKGGLALYYMGTSWAWQKLQSLKLELSYLYVSDWIIVPSVEMTLLKGISSEMFNEIIQYALLHKTIRSVKIVTEYMEESLFTYLEENQTSYIQIPNSDEDLVIRAKILPSLINATVIIEKVPTDPLHFNIIL